METMKMPDSETLKKEQNFNSEQEIEKSRQRYEKTLKKAAFRENFSPERIVSLLFLSGKAIKNLEDIMIAEAYAYKELREAKEKDLEDEGKNKKEINEFLAELDKEFYDADLLFESTDSSEKHIGELEGFICGHEIKIIQTVLGYNKIKYDGYVDGKSIDEDKAKELFDKYQYLGILKYNAAGEAIKINEKNRSTNS